MNILVVSQYYPPEPGAPSNRVAAFVEAMVKREHRVTVICEFPNYPSGRLAPQDRWRLFRVEKNGGYRIIRTFVLTFEHKNNIKRMLYYLSFALSSFVVSLFLKRHDVVFTSSPPIFHACMAMLTSKLKRARFVVDIRDLWPDTVAKFEAVENKRMLKWGRRLERGLYRNACIILTVSAGLANAIGQRGGSGKTSICYNGTDENILNWHRPSGLVDGNKVVVLYAGIIGLGQNLVSLVPHVLQLESNNVKFSFIGNGPQKNMLENELRQRRSNALTLSGISREEVIPYLCGADILMVVLREDDFFRSAIPSKFFDYMAAGKPIVSNVDGELREIMETYNTGIYFSLRQEGSFQAAIERLANDPELRRQMGENGRKLVREKFLRSKLADEAVRTIEETIARGRV